MMTAETNLKGDLDFDRGFLTAAIRGDSRLRDLVGCLSELPAATDPAHDTDHCVRVAIWSVRCDEGKSDLTDLIAAAYLHDLVWVAKDSADRKQASQFSALAAGELLDRYRFSDNSKMLIQDAILNHSYSRGLVPQYELGKAVQDADRLECLGAIGIARCFSVGAQMKASFFDPQDPWARERKSNDRQFSLDHYFTKIFRLEEMMNTRVGREEARVRTKYMRQFVRTFGQEALLGTPEIL
jgi:uncharacterized protein